MGARRRSGRGWRSGIAKFLAGAGLISVGVCLGVVLGSVLDGPRLFVRRLSQGVQRVEIQASPSSLGERQSLPPTLTAGFLAFPGPARVFRA